MFALKFMLNAAVCSCLYALLFDGYVIILLCPMESLHSTGTSQVKAVV